MSNMPPVVPNLRRKSASKRRLSVDQRSYMLRVTGDVASITEVELIKNYQRVCCHSAETLKADGIAGLKTQATIPDILAIPKGRKELEKVYGHIQYKDLPKGRIEITNGFARDNIVRVKFTLTRGELFREYSIQCHKEVAAELPALLQKAVDISGYLPGSVVSFVPRHTGWNTAGKLSLHSYGIAIDIDHNDNWIGGVVRNTDRPSLLRRNPSFVEVFRDAGWTWGGDFSFKDDMHFQRAFV
jgi:hypothetical protein